MSPYAAKNKLSMSRAGRQVIQVNLVKGASHTTLACVKFLARAWLSKTWDIYNMKLNVTPLRETETLEANHERR